MIVELFSKRQKKLRGEVPDVYTYDRIPNELRIQIAHLLREVMGEPFEYETTSENLAIIFMKTIKKEHSLLDMYEYDSGNDGIQTLINYFLNVGDHEKSLDVVELVLSKLSKLYKNKGDFFKEELNAETHINDGIDEFNQRMQEHGIGYKFESGKIIRIDSEIVHQDVIKTTLGLISHKDYQAVDDEYLTAHEHFRHGRYEESMVECLKAFESTIKVICSKRGWYYEDKYTAKQLLNIIYEKELIPSYLQSHLTGLRSALEGVATLRNKEAGHGAGTEINIVPQHFDSYCLHLTASNILFLIKCEEELD